MLVNCIAVLLVLAATAWEQAVGDPIPVENFQLRNSDDVIDYFYPPGQNRRDFGTESGRSTGDEELVWLEDRNNDHHRRHLDAGLPDSLNFILKRNTGSDVTLTLKENKRLKRDFPMYEVNENNEVIDLDVGPITDKRFYHDQENGAAFMVSCRIQEFGACKRVLEGSLNIEGRGYEIKPAPTSKNTRGLTSESDVPHLITRVQTPNIAANDAREQDDLKSLEDEVKKAYSDREKRSGSNQEFGIQLAMVVDPGMWTKYFAITQPTATMTKVKATYAYLKERFVHITNGVSLRYESIEDSSMDIYVTICQVMVYKRRHSTSPIPSSVPTVTVDGDISVHGQGYLLQLQSIWYNVAPFKRAQDHVMVVTGYKLIVDYEDTGTELLGLTYFSGACNEYAQSIIEDNDYYTVTTLAAHELGHNLGAVHDGTEGAYDCYGGDDYIMRASVPKFTQHTEWDINPWRFSSCSVAAIVNFLSSGQCQSGPGQYFSESQWEAMTEQDPGERHPPEEQCRLLLGDDSYICRGAGSSQICLTMGCHDSQTDSCHLFAAARGTACGDKKYCRSGKCTLWDELTTTPKPTMRPIPDGCINRAEVVLAFHWDCPTINLYFTTAHDPIVSTEYWCSDHYHYTLCCEWCEKYFRKHYPEDYYRRSIDGPSFAKDTKSIVLQLPETVPDFLLNQ